MKRCLLLRLIFSEQVHPPQQPKTSRVHPVSFSVPIGQYKSHDYHMTVYTLYNATCLSHACFCCSRICSALLLDISVSSSSDILMQYIIHYTCLYQDTF